MSKIFLLSNSFVVNNIVWSLNHVLTILIDEVFLLKENHRTTEFDHMDNITVHLYKNIDDCINGCDFILIVQDDNIPQKTINYVYNKSIFQNKKCIIINNPWRRNYSNSFLGASGKICKSKPTLLNISIGESAQPYRLEMLINNIFTKKNVRIKQFFSDQTNIYLSELKKNDILSDNLINNISDDGENCDVLICTVCIDENLSQLKNALEQVRLLCPDFIILQTNANCEIYTDLYDIIEFNLFSKIDLKICSNYYNYDNLYNVYCKDIFMGDGYENIESYDLGKKIEELFFNKLSLPPSVQAL